MVSLSDLTIVISSFLFFTPMPKFNNWLNKYIFIAYSVQGTVACHWGYLCKDEMFSVNLGLLFNGGEREVKFTKKIFFNLS